MNNDTRNATRQFLLKANLKNMSAVTLSMKQNIISDRLDAIKAIKNQRHFMNLLNKKAYGNSFKRHGKKIEVIPVLETSHAGRLHYHLAISNPYPEDEFWLDVQIPKSWYKTDWGYSEIKIKHGADAGWINYITKLGPHDEVDWENMHRVR